MTYIPRSFCLSLCIALSGISSAQDDLSLESLSGLSDPVDMPEVKLPLPPNAIEQERIEKAEEEARIKAKADSEKDAEVKIELAKSTAIAAKMAQTQYKDAEAEAQKAEARAKALRKIANKESEVSKQAELESVNALKAAEEAVILAKKNGSGMFNNVVVLKKDTAENVEDKKEEGVMTIAEAISSEEYEEVFQKYRVERGTSLSLISAKAYDRPGYWRILKLHNGVSPEKLILGQVINAPDLRWLCADSQLSKFFPVATRDLLESRRLFMEVEDEIAQNKENGVSSLSKEQRAKIDQSATLLRNARKRLLTVKSGVKQRPNAAALQLLTASQKMKGMQVESLRTAANQNLIHEHISNGIVYSVLWARSGFN